jgi:2-isopropylmalate synthase
MAIVELAMDGTAGSTFGAGLDANIVTASIRAIVAGLNRTLVRGGDAAVATAESALLVPATGVA